MCWTMLGSSLPQTCRALCITNRKLDFNLDEMEAQTQRVCFIHFDQLGLLGATHKLTETYRR